MKKKKFLSLYCPKYRGEKKHCQECPVFAREYCRGFSDYLEDNFKHVRKDFGQHQPSDFSSYLPPLTRMFKKLEDAFNYDGKGTLREWLEKEYGKYQYLSLKCPERKGTSRQCRGCIVQKAGHCKDLIEFIKNKLLLIEKKQQKDFWRSNSDENSLPVTYDKISRLGNSEEDIDVINALLLSVENNFTYTGSGSFKSWLNSISNNIFRETCRSYNRHGETIRHLLARLDTANIKILAGKRHTNEEQLLDKKIQYAAVPNKRAWENPENLVIIHTGQIRDFAYLSAMNSLTLLVFGPDKQISYYTEFANTIQNNNGIVLRWRESIKLPKVRSYLAEILNKEKNKEKEKIKKKVQEEGTLKEKIKISLLTICDQLLNLGITVETTVQQKQLALRMVSAIRVPGKLPGQRSASLQIIDIRRQNMLKLLSCLDSMTVLVHGTGKYGTEHDQQYLQTLHDAARSMQNQGILLWWKEDNNGEVIQASIQNMFRAYINVEGFPQASEDNEEDNSSPEDGVAEGDSVGDEQTFEELLENKQLARDVRHCLEEAMTHDTLRDCASLMYFYMSIYKKFCKRPDMHEKAFKKNGKIKTTAIYDQLAELLDESPANAKQLFRRCLQNGAPFSRFIRGCLIDYE